MPTTFDQIDIVIRDTVTQSNGISSSDDNPVAATIHVVPPLHITDEEVWNGTHWGTHIENQSVTHLAGFWVHLKPDRPDGTNFGNSGCTWTLPSYFPADAVSSYVNAVILPSASPVPAAIPSPTPGGTYEAFWYNIRAESPAPISVSCDIAPSGTPDFTLSATTTYAFETPTPHLTVSYGPFQVYQPGQYRPALCTPVPDETFSYGEPCPSSTPGVSWSYTITPNDTAEQNGNIELWQIIGTFSETLDADFAEEGGCGDREVPYGNYIAAWNATWFAADAPYGTNVAGTTFVSGTVAMDDYLMYQPAMNPNPDDGKSIWISLGHIKWGGQATATAPPTGGSWSTTATLNQPTALDNPSPTPYFPYDCP